MSARIPKEWTVHRSFENAEHDRCVDLFERDDGSWGFEEFRRDVEDRGAWTPIAYYSGVSFETRQDAQAKACEAVPWLPAAVLRPRG